MKRDISFDVGAKPPKCGRVLTRSRLLFESIGAITDRTDIHLVLDNNGLGISQNAGREFVVMVDLESFPLPEWKELNEGTILIVGKGDGLVNAWKRFLEDRPKTSMPDGLEGSLREKVRETLSRCQWPGGAYAFFQGIVEEVLISEALRITGGNRQKTARLLGISRTTLRNRLKEPDSEDQEVRESRK